jgi:hypothetical protein
VTTEETCKSFGGTFAGIGTECTEDLCGACCLRLTAQCIHTTRDDCRTREALPGDFLPGVECAQETCGACCERNVGCVVEFEENCPNSAERFFIGLTCQVAPCGACCEPGFGGLVQCADGRLESECSGPEQRFLGPGSTCGGGLDSCAGPQPCGFAAVAGVPDPCDDGDACTDCQCNLKQGVCVCAPVECEDGNPCTVNRCDPHEGCVIEEFNCGACCFDPPSAIDCFTTPNESHCSTLGGRFRGPGTICDLLDPPCREPVGACCMGGNCEGENLTEAACLVPDPASTANTWFEGQRCAETCSGACCKPDGTCLKVLLTRSECEGIGGTYLGNASCSLCPRPDGTPCSANSDCQSACIGGICAPPSGSGGPCDEADHSDCAPSLVCVGGICSSDAPGSCCLPDGACETLDRSICALDGGFPLGVPCTKTQACCDLENGICFDADPSCCQQRGGIPSPAPFGCSVPRACCLPDDSCADLAPACCRLLGGFDPDPERAGIRCLGDSDGNGLDDVCECPRRCGDLDGDGDVDSDDVRILTAALGLTAKDPLFNGCADYDRDGVITNLDMRAWRECLVRYLRERSIGDRKPEKQPGR